MKRTKRQKDLRLYRLRIGLTQKQVAMLLDHRDVSRISKYETGGKIPPLITAFDLSIAYRVPVEFLYHDLYIERREMIRAREDRLVLPRQPVLF